MSILPRLNENDPSGMLPTEKAAAREAEGIIGAAIDAATKIIIENNITDPIQINRIVKAALDQAEEHLQLRGLVWVRDAESKAIIRSNVAISKMGHVSIVLGPIGLPKELTERLMLNVLNDVSSLTMDTRKTVARVLADGMNQGLGARQLARNIRDETAIDISRARTIARSTVMKTYNEAAFYDYKKAGAKGYMVYPTMDERLCPVCRKVAFENGTDGKLKVYTDYPGLPLHPNCRCSIWGLFEGEEPVSLSAPAVNFITFEELIDCII